MAGTEKKCNYQKKLEQLLAVLEQEGKCPRLLLHSCCGPCSSYVLEYLSRYFEITVLYYNPNIDPPQEYDSRVREQRRLIEEMTAQGVFAHPVSLIQGDFDPSVYYQAVKGHERDREGGERCFICYELRLRETARRAAEGGFDYFTTTLSISPLKNAEKLNQIGEKLAGECGVPYLYSDFKKRNGYKRSVELSALYGLYRQDYCGCVYSRAERQEEKAKRERELASQSA